MPRRSIITFPSPEPEQTLEKEQSQPQLQSQSQPAPICCLVIDDVDISYMISDSYFQFIALIPMSTSPKDDFISFYRDITKNNNENADFIKNFEDTYVADQATKWLYELPFIKKFLEIIYIYHSIEPIRFCQFLINDIQNLLKQHMCNSSIKVYRYEIISNEQLEYLNKSKNQIVAIKYFFLANTDRTKASQSITSQDPNNKEHVVFTVEANPQLSGIKPFAKIGSIGSKNDINDVLFMIGSVFQVTDIVKETNDLTNIKLTLCAVDTTNTNQQICERIKTKYMKESNGIDTIAFGQFVLDLGKELGVPAPLDDVEKLILTSMNKLVDDDLERCRCYHILGTIAFERKDCDKTLEWYTKSLDLNKQKQSNNYTYLTKIYSNLGKIYLERNQLSEALDSYNELVQLHKHNSDDDCLDLIFCYYSIAIIYEKQEKFRDELSYYYRSLSIMNNHHQFVNEGFYATLYSNIGIVYTCLEEYHLALGYFRTALNKQLKLQSNASPLLAKLYKNIGFVYEHLNDIEQVKYNYNEAINIYGQLNDHDDQNVKDITETLQKLSVLN